MGLPVHHTIAVRNPTLHASLLREECQETCSALIAGNVVEVVDGLADIIVVSLGVAGDCGVDLCPIFDEVMRSNNTKTPGNKSPTGKLMKGPTFQAPRITPLLIQQGWETV